MEAYNAPNPQFPGTPPPTDGAANAALLLGILSLICLGPLAGIPAIICGHVGRARIARSGGTLGGGAQALAGLLMGYASIVLLLVAGAIIARVAAKNGPKLLEKANPGAVAAQQAKMQTALQQYKADFGQLPQVTAIEGEEVDMKALVEILGGKNAKGTSYYASGGTGFYLNGVPVDSAFQTLHVAIDLNGDGTVSVGQLQVAGICAVWSSGPNKTNEYGSGDDVVSW